MRFSLEPPVGVVTDETTFASPGLWDDADGVRFFRDRPEVVGGYEKLIVTQLTGTCRNALMFADSDLNELIAFGTHSALQVLKDGTLYTITPTTLPEGNESYVAAGAFGEGGFGIGPYGGGAGSDSAPRTWSLDNYGSWLLACPRYDTIYKWEGDTSAVAVALSGAPAAVDTMCVADTRQVVAFGTCEEVSGTYNAMCIRGTNVEDPTDWTASNSDLAFEYILEEGTRIVRGLNFGSNLLVFTDTSIYLGSTTGDTNQPWRFDIMGQNCGLSNANAVTVIGQTVFWMTPAYRFMMFRLDTGVQPLACPISRDFIDNLDTVEIEKVHFYPVPKFDEVWLSYPDSRDGNECSRVLIYSVTGNCWSKWQIARTASVTSASELPILVGGGYIYTHETGTTADGSSLSWMLQSTGTYVNEGETRVYVLGAWPDFEAQGGSINLTLTTQDYPQATAVDKGPWALAVGREKRDFRVEGRIVGTRWEGVGFARFGKPTFEVRPGGRR